MSAAEAIPSRRAQAVAEQPAHCCMLVLWLPPSGPAPAAPTPSAPLPPPREPGPPYRVCLVCLGNICRSPMAETVLRASLAEAGLDGAVRLDSAGTGDWHVGEPMYQPAQAALARWGYDGSAHRARQWQPSWLAERDLVLAMDAHNLAALRRIAGSADRDPIRLPFLRRAVDAGALRPDDARLVEAVIDRIGSLAGPPEPPSRIHGDCWAGNVLWSRGRGWLIDPAAHGGHRETDLAMLALFGAPDLDRILAGYNDTVPLAAGWRSRIPLHQLHPLLVHACLFGASYREEVRTAARAALAS